LHSVDAACTSGRAISAAGRALIVGEPLPAQETESLCFNPVDHGTGIRPSGWFNPLRDAAYRQASAPTAPAARALMSSPRRWTASSDSVLYPAHSNSTVR